MLQWFMRFPEFAEFSQFLFHLVKSPVCCEKSSFKQISPLLVVYLGRTILFIYSQEVEVEPSLAHS